MMARMGTGFGRTTTASIVGLIAVSMTASLAGCSWRLETPAPSWPSPSAAEMARNEAALAEARIVDSFAVAAPVGLGGKWLLDFETTAAPSHLDALGGVYVPYPDEATEPDPSDRGNDGDPREFFHAVEAARDTELTLALTVDDPDLALLLASMGLSHAAALAAQVDEDSRAAGVTVTRSLDRVPPSVGDVAFGPLVPMDTTVPVETLDRLIVLHDEAQYAYEVVTARATGKMRPDAYNRGLLHGTRARALLALVPDDPRGPSYVLPDRGEVGDLTALRLIVRDVESSLSDAYLAAFAALIAPDGLGGTDGQAERAWLLAAAYDALVASVLWGDPAPWDDVPLPAGLDEPEVSDVSAPGDLDAFPGITLP